MATIKIQMMTNADANVGNGKIIHSWWGSKSKQPLWKVVCKFLKKKERNLPHHLTILLFHINLDFVTYSLDNCLWMFICTLLLIEKCPDVPQMKTWWGKGDIFSQWNTTQLLRLDKPWGTLTTINLWQEHNMTPCGMLLYIIASHQ